MRILLAFALVAGLSLSPSAVGMGSGLRELLQALGEIGRQHNEASNQRNAAELLLFGGPGHMTFLGCLNCNQVSPMSVSNTISQYGFTNNLGVWSSIGQYASTFSPYSACNQLAPDAPVIVDRAGNAYGRFSINQFATGSVCSVTGSQQACQLVTAVCASKN